MILLEIERNLDRQIIRDRLLGEHQWNEFLYNPSPDEKDRTTKIFHSFYSKGRDAQKDGEIVSHVSIWLLSALYCI